MADNRNLAALSGNAAADELTYSGDMAVIPLVRIVSTTGAEGAKSLVELVGSAGSAAAGVLTVQGIGSGTALNTSAAVTSIAAGDNNIGNVDIVTTPKASTAALSNVAGSASSVTLKAANANRRALIIVNESSATLYIKFGATASATDYTYQLQAGDTHREELYTGIVDGIWASATGAARVTELTV